MFCVAIELAAVFIMSKKTACMLATSLTAVFLLCIGILAYFAQLFMYTLKVVYAEYAVIAALAIMYAGIISVSVYCFSISKRSDGSLCKAAGIFGFLPPVGTAFTVRLLFKMKFDTPAQELIYSGYAKTYAVLGGFCQNSEPQFIDGADDEEFEELDKKAVKAKLRELEKRTSTADGQFEYAETLMHYVPAKAKKAIALYEKAAKSDHKGALFNLGYCYETGAYVKRDLRRAAELYARAAELGDKESAIRQCIVDTKDGRVNQAYTKFETIAKDGSPYATYDLALCCERGLGTYVNLDKAIDYYLQCGDLYAAKKRLVTLAAERVKQNGGDAAFEKVVSHGFEGELRVVMDGLKAVKEKRASDAADLFLQVVKMRGEWEGLARCLVGALYIDNGATDADRQNGAAYIKSAIGMTPVAAEVYKMIPKEIISPKTKKTSDGEDKERNDEAEKPAADTNKEQTDAAEQVQNL